MAKHILFTAAVGSVAVAVILFWLKSRQKYKKKGISSLIGDTPLVRIDSLSDATGCEIMAKVEFVNVGGSPKDRVALYIIEQAENMNLITPNTQCTIFEGTVGSTGISIATIAKSKGYNAWIVMPDDVAIEKRQLLQRLGAHVECVRPCSIIDEGHFVNIARRRALEMNKAADLDDSLPRAFHVNQFENIDNITAHFYSTGPEIYTQTNGIIHALVLGCGTGGTLAGVCRYLKPRIPNLHVVLADPQGSGIYNKIKHGVMFTSQEAEGTRQRHQMDTIVEGVGLKRLTVNLTTAISYCNDSIKVTDLEALEMSRYLLKNDGLFVGSSSAVNLVAAYRLAKLMGPGKVIVTMLCDHGSRHMTKFWCDQYIEKRGLICTSTGLEFIGIN